VSIPPHVLAASLAALDLHDQSMTVAQLRGDSLVDDVPLEEGVDRHLVFGNDSVTVDVHVTHAGGARHLVIDVTPEDYEELIVVQPAGGIRRSVRDRVTHLRDLEPGLTTLVLRRRPDGSTHRTAWVVI
jgi:hypothetical protein